MATALADGVVARAKGDRRALAAWGALVLVGVVVGGALTAGNPLLHTNAAPFHGRWELLVRPPIVLAALIAIGVIALGPRLAEVCRWRTLLIAGPVTAFLWSAALSVSVGGHAFAAPVTTRYEYLAGVGAVESFGHFLRTFTSALPTYPTHIQGHPPGLVIALSALDRMGLGGPMVAATLFVAVGASAVAAVLLSVRSVCGEHAARRVAPYLILAPAAVWMATSGDAFFSGVGAWAVAATVLATATPSRRWAVVAGAVWSCALLSSYGLALLAPVAVAVAWRRRRVDVLVISATTAVGALLALGIVSGFWWPAGLLATRRAYLAGIAANRSAAVFIWLNVAAVAVACGPAVGAALRRVRGPATLLVGGAIAGIVLADVSLLSKAEVERIWLPWVPWLLVACVALPALHRRRWLAAQAATALTVQMLLRSPW